MPFILVVDDDPDFQDMICMILESAGHEVKSVFNSVQAAKIISLDFPQLILLDVMMTTETEGIDFARKLRSVSETSSIPIIMLSSIYAERKLTNIVDPDPENLPVDIFLDKPVKPAVLLKAVKDILVRSV